MKLADQIRKYTLDTFILPARLRGEKLVSFSATQIHDGMELEQRFPAVCGAIDAEKFLDYAGVVLVKREGPFQSSTSQWAFEV